jgi:hypothetical protein
VLTKLLSADPKFRQSGTERLIASRALAQISAPRHLLQKIRSSIAFPLSQNKTTNSNHRQLEQIFSLGWRLRCVGREYAHSASKTVITRAHFVRATHDAVTTCMPGHSTIKHQYYGVDGAVFITYLARQPPWLTYESSIMSNAGGGILMLRGSIRG